MEKIWMKVRTISGKEMLGYTVEKEKKPVEDGHASLDDIEDMSKIELHAPTGLFVDLEKKVHLIPETDANNLKDAVVVINANAIESYMVVPDTSELVRAISSQITGIVIPKTGNNITNIRSVK